jgi:enamine deaminase RidA (YjgF/YER057c/UK114 family)
MEIRNLASVPPPVGPYSHVAVTEAGARLAHIAGQVGSDERGALVGLGDFVHQCRQAFANLELVLRELGASFEDVAYLRGYLARREDLPAYREERERLYARVCPGKAPPTTTLVVAALYHPDCLFEVDALAILR